MEGDDQLVKTLKELGITEENHRVLALLPLVLVAWADGKMQRAEIQRILDIARTHGFIGEGGTAATDVLDGWLAEKPSKEHADKALRALVELARRKRGMGADLNADTLHKLEGLCLDIAAAAGGLFGLTGKVSAAEEEVIDSLAGVLHIDDGHSWKELLEELE